MCDAIPKSLFSNSTNTKDQIKTFILLNLVVNTMCLYIVIFRDEMPRQAIEFTHFILFMDKMHILTCFFTQSTSMVFYSYLIIGVFFTHGSVYYTFYPHKVFHLATAFCEL